MKTSNNGIELIKRFEGCRLSAYQCPSGVWTIGYGHTAGVCKGMTITQQKAEEYLKIDLTKYENYVTSTGLKLNQNQFDALVSFTYNCGNGNLKKLIRNRTLSQIADAILLYNKSNGKVLEGLKRRRTAERELLLKLDGNESSVKVYSKKRDGNTKLSENFKVKEFACKDGSDEIKIDSKVAGYLQAARDRFKVPIYINSAYRTPAYNKKIGGASKSYHMQGRAVDHHAKGKVALLELARFYESIGCLGIIVYPNSGFVHIDSRTTKYFAIDCGNGKIEKKTSFMS